MKNQVLSILIPNEATGYKIIQLASWTGKCFAVPRTELKELEKRAEAGGPGVYFLFGENDESTNQKLYIGESERFYERLVQHDAKKDFWNNAVIFTGGLDKAKIKRLEYLATSQAHDVNRYDIQNTFSSKANSLSEFDEVITDDFFAKMSYILSALGYPVFQTIAAQTHDSKIYVLKADGCHAKAKLLDDGSVLVLKGSLSRIRQTEALKGWSLMARKRFFEEGTMKDKGDGISYMFTKDVLFKSPSAAASTVTGRPSNGWILWKDEKGNTLDENLRK